METLPPDLTAEQYRALKKSAGGYWGIQFVACTLFVLLGIAGVVAAWGYGIGFTGGDAAAGDGLLSLITAAAFGACIVYLLTVYRKNTGLGRLRYAWVLRQTGLVNAGNVRNPVKDVRAMSLAQKASQGELTHDELAALQALDPNFPFPWRIPPR
ncbi:hypothetical protein [Mycetocola zhadangensis]|uniref:Uncharacterized protein n=1 Tax=Mycetocola zhadangensis TaxID=1164595 RepID=A0A3L7J4H6_9MICO|nr:hypothetical protein [Mycetocola zhadangensis]RLQ84361.1 hypothetical protein D9V28_09190 [Mycetocola zhadangensis]GGE93712.1 hypothetical protein GCM10011313_15850 [Mycetocola zhadangensis]